MIEVQVMVGLGQGQEQIQTETGLDVLSVENMTHFARECPTRRENR